MGRTNDIAARAALGFALVSGVTAIAVISSAVLARRTANEREQILVRYSDDLEHASQAQAAAERMVAGSRGYLLTEAPQLLAGVRDAEDALDAALEALDHGDDFGAEWALLREVRASATHYRHLLDDILRTTTASEDRITLAKVLRERLLPARVELDEGIESLVAAKRRQQEYSRVEAARIASRATWATLALGSVALLLSGLLARSFTRHLADLYRREQASTRSATRALAAKQELLGIIAHDLRSPLTSILLRASAIARNSGDRTVQSSATSIQTTCSHMSDLIQSLLDAAIIEAGRLSVVITQFSVAEMLSDTLETFTPVASESAVRLEQDLAPRTLEIRADRGRLSQVLSNLVGNALSFTPGGGVVTVSARETERGVTFAVRDTGPGIAPEHQPHVFERHWRLDQLHTDGVGLGLYIARGIVEAHGGRIWVECPPGKGSSFQFEIPRSLSSLGAGASLGDDVSVPAIPALRGVGASAPLRHS